ncbi:MAG TPA: TIM barrel protein [Armatimonadota bacterium]|nr:TIM barrel protein [Armatimonadota bacterium]
MSLLILGTVSNGWTDLLASSSLEAQCQRVLELDFEYVELRQRAMGACEEPVAGDDRPWPLPERLAELTEALPELGFNLAVEAPYLTAPLPPDDPYLQRCIDAAAALGGVPPVLRLVDLSPVSCLLEHEDAIAELGYGIAQLAAAAWRRGVRLALENSKQPVSSLLAVVERAAAQLPEDVPAPQLCWDAHNQISQTLLVEDPVRVAGALPLASLFEFHFKQSRAGRLLGDVEDGEIDWRAILSVLRARGYHGPALFELPPGPDIWQRLERSAAYIRDLLREIDARPE